MIEARRLALELNSTPVLTDVTMTVPAGAAVGLTGANGSGKSSLLRCFATLQRPTSGELRVLGADALTHQRRAIRRHICLIGHESGLYPELSLRENLRLVAHLCGRLEEDAVSALESVGLARAADRPFAASSKGMVRRTELARVLIQKPRLLLLDEAHAGLDEASSDLVDQVVARVVAGGGAAVVVSHEAERLRDVVGAVFQIESGVVGLSA